MNSQKTLKIVFEEHFMTPGFEEYSKSFTQHIDQASFARLSAKLNDIGDLRLAEMDRHNIQLAVLSQTGPGVQGEVDPARALEQARRSNDFLAEKIQQHPTRFAGFACLPMHDPLQAADELTRCVEQLGFKGALVNGHTQGRYYDDPAYDVFWERVQALDVPFYLHPADAYVPLHAFGGHPELTGAVWGWGVETATHALRLLFSGVFDRFPQLKVVLGHMGEGLPFFRWRLDSRFPVYSQGVTLEHAPSVYIGRNLLITTSGVCSHASLQCSLDEIGPDAVMFSVDYPYESTEVAAEFIESAPMSDALRAQICHGNAQRLFKLPGAR